LSFDASLEFYTREIEAMLKKTNGIRKKADKKIKRNN